MEDMDDEMLLEFAARLMSKFNNGVFTRVTSQEIAIKIDRNFYRLGGYHMINLTVQEIRDALDSTLDGH